MEDGSLSEKYVSIKPMRFRIAASGSMTIMLPSLTACLVVFCSIAVFCFVKVDFRRREYTDLRPPIVHISEDDMLKRPREVFERALRDHGHIIGFRRRGRLEYVVDDRLTREVLTGEHMSFSEGAFEYLNIHYLHNLFAGYFIELEEIVRNCVLNRMPLIIEQTGPIFADHVEFLLQSTKPTTNNSRNVAEPHYVDFADHAHRVICHAMATIIFGTSQLEQRSLDAIERIAADLATSGGLYQNRSWWGRKFPKLWRMWQQLKMSVTSMPLFYYAVGLQVWNDLKSKRIASDEKATGSVLDFLSRRFARDNGQIGILEFMKISGLLIGIIFASVHLTATVAIWVTYELAVRPEYLPALREEMSALIGTDFTKDIGSFSFDALRDARTLDSFIREVLRTRGDILSPVRYTTADVGLGGYTVPKGHLVLIFAPASHFSTSLQGPDAADFDGNRWTSTDKQAVTVGSGYLLFGLGRWACPGRVLAITEIKMIIWSIISRATPVLKGNRYFVVDPLEVSGTPPDGEFALVPYSH